MFLAVRSLVHLDLVKMVGPILAMIDGEDKVGLGNGGGEGRPRLQSDCQLQLPNKTVTQQTLYSEFYSAKLPKQTSYNFSYCYMKYISRQAFQISCCCSQLNYHIMECTCVPREPFAFEAIASLWHLLCFSRFRESSACLLDSSCSVNVKLPVTAFGRFSNKCLLCSQGQAYAYDDDSHSHHIIVTFHFRMG